jgi:hypothetical protein
MARTAEECSKTLESLGKNPFDAFGYVGSEPIYRETIQANPATPYLKFGLLPPGIIFMIGVGIVVTLR